MIQAVYIVNHGGETQAAITLGDFQVDEVLFGGFLSAIQMYTQEMSGTDLEELSLADFRMLISRTQHSFLVSVHDRSDKNAAELNRKARDILANGMDEVITEDTVELIREAVALPKGAGDRAGEWASKML
ncbi:MAG: hypothetical protein ACFE7R_00190 [Candidatus Hodarchaeota archaeon]